MRAFRFLGLLAVVAPLVSGCAGSNANDRTAGGDKIITTKSGLKYEDLKEGTGKEAKAGSYIGCYYTGWVKATNEKFASNVGQGLYEFKLGNREVIAGWDEGIVGMKEGGKRKLLIPADLAYGRTGKSPIPPNADLIFEVEVVKVH